MQSVSFYIDDAPADAPPAQPPGADENGAAAAGEASSGEPAAAVSGPASGTAALKEPAASRARTNEESAEDPLPERATSRWATTLSFLVPDAGAFALTALVLYLLAEPAGEVLPSGTWLWPAAALVTGAFAGAGLYHRALTMHPIQELRYAGGLATVVLGAYVATLGLAGAVEPGWMAGWGIVWGIATPLLLLARAKSRILFARADWWGAPVLVLASDPAARAVVHNLQRWPEIGLRPVAVVQPTGAAGSSGDGAAAATVDGVPVLHGADRAPELMHAREIAYAIVSRPDFDSPRRASVLRRCSQFCRQVFVVPDPADATALWTGQQAFHGFSGYGVCHANGRPAARLAKRCFDGVAALAALIVTAPLLGAIAVLTKLDSAGPVFYRQLRVGWKGRCFTVLKFRTMHVDAEERLEALLQHDHALRKQYDEFHNLEDDPRVTRLGAVLRAFSLDELPQFWNILKGEMSLTGPRAYMPGELSDMRDLERVIVQRRPGLSGLWQVSGRNMLSFEERTRMDVHYVQHWSFWLDLYILARTLPAVLDPESAA
jgi:Undecaprenyl-phosphate galactose phosphotransferase WbaP